ncbi:unnamed protein product, partial [Porites lobata]
IAEVYYNEGNEACFKEDYSNAIYFYTEGIKVNCKDIDLKDQLYSKRAYANLRSAKEIGNKSSKGIVNNALGVAYLSLGDVKKAIEFFHLSLPIAKETKNKGLEGTVYNNLGGAFDSLGVVKKAIGFFHLSLPIAKETGDKDLEGTVYNNLGSVFDFLGDVKKAIEFFHLSLPIAKETGNKGLEGKVYKNLGSAFDFLGDVKKAIGGAYLYITTLGAIDSFELSLRIAKATGNKYIEGSVYGNFGRAYYRLGDVKEAVEFSQLSLSIAKETGHKDMEQFAYRNLADGYFYILYDFCKAEEFAKSSIKLFEEMRVLLPEKDEWKICFRNKDGDHDRYRLLWKIQLQLGKTHEALFTAEAGRAQALMDLMKSQYGVRKSVQLSSKQQMELMMFSISNHISSPTLFLAEDSKLVNLRLLLKGDHRCFAQRKISDDLTLVIKQTYQKIGVRGVNQTLDEPKDEKECALKGLYLIEGDELIIIPDRSSFLIPFAALVDQHSRYFSETSRHSTSGAVLVGNPWVETVRIKGCKPFPQLPGAEEEVKMIGKILNIEPLTGKKATKDQVLSRFNSVSLVHIAAHGCPETGEIILSPNLAISDKPEEKDFLLTMAEVLGAQLRAKLVVLSRCYSARGEINAEGVVGITRAFLGAGARSVIASLWEISDEATQEFMRHFYEHLLAGKSASKSLHHAMKSLRKSEKFNAVEDWAPFVLIGDDVTLNFGQEKVRLSL